MTRCTWLTGILLVLLAAAAAAVGDDLSNGFKSPPDSARPWVYWFWLNGNITRDGITADLEAMRRVGIGGVLIMEVDQGAPLGPVGFASPPWRELFKHVCAEANRLGLEVNMNDDAGWCGSGGPWITPELAMQKVVWTETAVQGPRRFDEKLPQPKAVANYYRDIAVLAFPLPPAEAEGGSPLRIDDIEGKAAFTARSIPPRSTWPDTAPGSAIERARIVDVTKQCGPDGQLAWDVPDGQWVLMRIGYTPTGAVNAPAPESGRGLECDKLSKEGIEAHFAGFMAKLVADVGPLAGKTLVTTHIDSWEVGSQNWTPRFREEFQQRRGYDPLPFLPVMSGRVVETLEVSERFLWDLRQTVSDLLVENYAGHMRTLAQRHGLRLSIEAYGEPADDMAYAGQADEPMCEFWSHAPYGAADTCVVMASAAHVYGKPILGAEAFTADDNERWRDHPGSIKAMGDWAFCEGINRFVFHRYALQPWSDRRPGMSMGPWGLHYERGQTWWEQTKPWHEYLARCQFLLQKGLFVADICYLAPEGSPQHFVPPSVLRADNLVNRSKYNFDACPPAALLTRIKAQDGRLVLPDGMSYRLLVLPPVESMTPGLLRRVKELVDAGATVLGAPPAKSPSLADYPQCDAEVKKLAAELWGDCDGKTVTEHRYGQGKVVWSKTPEAVLAETGVPPDFDCQTSGAQRAARYTHRTIAGSDVYFVANGNRQPAELLCSFRVPGRRPEFWWPETGRIEPAAAYDEVAAGTRVPIALDACESVFVVFRSEAAPPADRVVALAHDGQPLGPKSRPAAKIIVQTATYGVPDDPARTRDVKAKLQRLADLGEYEFRVSSLAQGDDPAYGVVKTLRAEYTVDGQPHATTGKDSETVRLVSESHQIVVHTAAYGVPNDPARTRDVTAKVQRLADAGTYEFPVSSLAKDDDPAYLVVKTLQVEYTVDGARQTASGTDPQTVQLLPAAEMPDAQVRSDGGRVFVEARKPGRYDMTMSSGKVRRVDVPALPGPLEITGPWEVSFAPGWGAPERVVLEQLTSWSKHDDAGVRCFSGSASYRKAIKVPADMLGNGKRLYLDLGRVEVIAEVKLNGKDLGILWKPPFRVDVTEAVKPGENTLEVKVVNLWVNRLIGDEFLPEDSERNPDGTLKAWPQWLQEGKPSPTGRYTFTSWRLWKKDAALLDSGLLGPVTLQMAERREITAHE